MRSEVSTVKSRSFVVPPGQVWSCIPKDGDGPCIAHEGDTVLIIVERSWEKAVRVAQEELSKESSK